MTQTATSEDCCSVCGPLANIGPTTMTHQGEVLNPLFEMIKQYTLTSEEVTLGAGERTDLSLIVQAEENQMGDMVVSELVVSTDTPAARFGLQIKSRQNDKIFSNVLIQDRFIATDAQLCDRLPCCFFIQSTQFIQVTVQNLEAVSVTFQLGARGTRFLPYTAPHFREQLLAYYNNQRKTPYWLGIDRVQGDIATLEPGGGVLIPAGITATCFMTVPGGGDFVAEGRPLAIVDGGPADAILCQIKEGASGRALSNEPQKLGSFVAKVNATVAGLQGGELRAASLRGCKIKQFFKRNQRLRIEMENTSGGPITVFLCYPGCMLYYSECAPGRGHDRSLSLEPVIGPSLFSIPGCPPSVTFDPQASAAQLQAQAAGPAGVPIEGRYLPPMPGSANTGGGQQTTMEQFLQSQQGQYARKTWNEQNLRAHGYLQGGMGGGVQLPDGGR
jgi:hypothetical protein